MTVPSDINPAAALALDLIASGDFIKNLGGGISEADPHQKAKLIASAGLRGDLVWLRKAEAVLRD